MIVAQDDIGSYFINGTAVTIGAQQASHGAPITFSVPTTLFIGPGTNNIAVSIYNSTAGYVWASWSLEIDCSGGTAITETSAGGGIEMYNYIPFPWGFLLPPPSNAVSMLPGLCGGTVFCVGAGWNPAINVTSTDYANWNTYQPVTVGGVPAALGADACAESGNAGSFAPGSCPNGSSLQNGALHGQELFFIQSFFMPPPLPTATNTPTATATKTPTGTPTLTFTITPTPTITATPTVVSSFGCFALSGDGEDDIVSDVGGWASPAPASGVLVTNLSPTHWPGACGGQWMSDNANGSSLASVPATMVFQRIFSVSPAVLSAGSFGITYGADDEAWFVLSNSSNPSGVTIASCLSFPNCENCQGQAVPAGDFASGPNTLTSYLVNAVCCYVGLNYELCVTAPTSTPTSSPTLTPTFSPTSTTTDTPTSTTTATPTATPTDTFTNTTTSTTTNTPSLTATSTSSDTPTAFPTSTATGTPTSTTTATPTATPTDTFTNTPTSTATGTPTATLTASPSPTNSFTPTSSPTSTPSSTPTSTPTITLTFTPTSSATDSPTPTMTFTPTSSPTSTPSSTPTSTPTVTATFTPTSSATNSPTSTVTSTLTSSSTPTPSSTPTSTPTVTATFTPTSSATNSPTSTVTSTLTSSPTSTPSSTPTSTPTVTATFTPTFSATNSPTSTVTSTLTSSPTPTPSSTPTSTPTVTATFTPTSSATNSPTASSTFTPTSSPTQTPTRTTTSTPTITHTFTPSFTPTNSSSPTATLTPCGYPGNTCTPTATPSTFDYFEVTKNSFTSSQPVSIFVGYSAFPGSYDLMIYNSAGEHIRTLASQQLSAPITQWYSWDGTNKYGDKCASGVYVIYLTEPFSVKVKRVIFLR